LDINVRKRSQVQVVQLKGQLRLGAAVDDLQRTVNESLAEGDARFVVNLSEVPMIDSSGIGLLVRFLASAKKRGGSVKLVNPSSFAQKTLRLVGVLNLFEVYEDDDQAVASFN
jgi:anti-sigma B factor antagonist